ncbi:response regulator transcription factor [Salinibacterium sp.]|uniref:response regulator transcription factor n=1 Tax=Salinibacterium sp. TaxID=1915057 RepID=UPI00286A3C2E|nr:response regulator transcription factor [Salinibacterium sp.]
MSQPTPPIRVLLVDDEALVRTGFSMILSVEDDIDIVGEATDGAHAVELAMTLHPDIVLMDLQMTGMDGIDATRRIVASTDSRVIVLTTFDRDDYLFEALGAGASGFLLKNTLAEDLVTGIRLVAAGNALLAPEVTQRVIARFADTTQVDYRPDLLADLTERELEVLGLVARGLSNAEIATQLTVGEATVKTHVSRLLAKLHLRDRVQAVVLAFECGVVSPGGGSV